VLPGAEARAAQEVPCGRREIALLAASLLPDGSCNPQPPAPPTPAGRYQHLTDYSRAWKKQKYEETLHKT